MPIPENMPKAAQDIFESTMQSLKGKTNKRTNKPYTDEERARIAWSAVKQKYHKKGDKWESKGETVFEDEVESELLEFKSEGGKHYFKGYLSTFDIDNVNDLVTPECMKDMLDQINSGVSGFVRSIKGSPDHDVYHMGDQQRVPISRITSGRLDNKGLFIEGMFNEEHPEFKSVWNQVENGFLDGLSIEYKPMDFAYRNIGDKKVRVLNRVRLSGYDHTPRPANPYSKLTDFFVKSIELADAEEEIKSDIETVKTHLREDAETWKSLAAKATKEMESDLRLLDGLEVIVVKEEEEKENKESEEAKCSDKKKEEEKMTEEKKEDVKSEPPAPAAEVKSDPKPAEAEVKAESKIDMEQIKAAIREEINTLIPKKEPLMNSMEGFDIKSDVTMTDFVVRSLGGR